MTRNHIFRRILAAIVTAGIAVTLLSNATPLAFGEDSLSELQVLQNKRNAYEKLLKGMTITQLANEMVADSAKGVAPFNSPAYEEVVSRGKDVGPELKAQLTKNDRTSFLGLLALRAVSRADYSSLDQRFRVEVLTDALRNSKYFNAWGTPNGHWGDAGEALIAEGKAIVPSLKTLLNDDRPAIIFGSEGASYYHVKDYASALLDEVPQ
jgi:hypothetical protein